MIPVEAQRLDPLAERADPQVHELMLFHERDQRGGAPGLDGRKVGVQVPRPGTRMAKGSVLPGQKVMPMRPPPGVSRGAMLSGWLWLVLGFMGLSRCRECE